MTTELERARRSLEGLPSSPKKVTATKLLTEIEHGRRRTAENLNKLEAVLSKLALSPREKTYFGLLPWFIALIAVAALYTGADAIWNAEYCSRGRSGVSCTYGIRAQLEGGATIAVAVAVLIATVPFRPSRAKSAVYWLVGPICAGLYFAPLVLRYVA